jgi:hypothetical protein
MGGLATPTSQRIFIFFNYFFSLGLGGSRTTPKGHEATPDRPIWGWFGHPCWLIFFIFYFLFFSVWALGVAGPPHGHWRWSSHPKSEATSDRPIWGWFGHPCWLIFFIFYFIFFFSLGIGGGRTTPWALEVVQPPLSFFKNIFYFFIILVFIYFLNIN